MPFEPVKTPPDLAQFVPHGAEFGHDLAVLTSRRLARATIRNLRHEVAALLMGHDHALGAEHVEPAPDGHRGDAVLPGQLALAGQAPAARVPPGGDPGPQVVGDLLVRGDRAVAADRHGQRLPSLAAGTRRTAILTLPSLLLP